MAKKKLEKQIYTGDIVEETEYFTVRKSVCKGNKFNIISKYDDAVYICDIYAIAGPAIIYEGEYGALYSNNMNWQKFTNHSFHTAELESWSVKCVNGKKQIKFVYRETNGKRFVRGVDADGNLYKLPRKQQKTKDDELSI